MSALEPHASAGEGLLVDDLRLTLGDIAPLAERAFADHDPVDAFLLAAGASQILRDQLEDDPGGVVRAAGVIGGPSTTRARDMLATNASRMIQKVRITSSGLRRALSSAATELDKAVDDLASGVFTGTWRPGTPESTYRVLTRAAAWHAPLGLSSVRQPSCFRSFDQHPRDIQTLARRVLDHLEDSSEGIVVLGVRTSGSYLAPLLAAALRLEGRGRVPWATVRPGLPLSSPVHAVMTALGEAGARVLLIDDPPGTGSSLARVARQLEVLGFGPNKVTLTLAVHQREALPAPLRQFDSVVLDWPDWDIHRRLAPDAVRLLLDRCLRERRRVVELSAFDLSEVATARGHAHVGYEATIEEPGGLALSKAVLIAEGSGLGYFGRHILALSRALPGLVPDVYGFEDGVTVRQWLPDGARVPLDSGVRVREAVHYVTRRLSALPARRDATASMAGQQPAWEVASRILASPYGPLGLALRSLGLDAAVRTMLAPVGPSVVDGQTGSRAWFEDDGALIKVNFAERAFSHLDLACYDAAFDVAGLALGIADPKLAEVARVEFESVTGERVDPERWLLYRLVHLWDRLRLDQLAPDAAELAMSRVWQDWCGARLLQGRLDGGDGPWCAIDIDGVLETSRLGAPVLTPSAAKGLATLTAHGFRPLLATGRSITEVQDRCLRYGMLGGVAEYGSAAYVHAAGAVEVLVDDTARRALAEARSQLSKVGGVVLAEGFVAALRAFRLDDKRRRVGLDQATIGAVVEASAGRLYAVRGLAQTDFVAAGVDKATGLRVLLALLGAHERDLAVAFGDGVPDRTMLRLAVQGLVPSHASALAGGTVRSMKSPYQRGFADAAATAVGHGHRGCSRCDGHDSPTAHGAQLLSALLSGLEGGRGRAAALAPEILRLSLALRHDESSAPTP